MAFSNPQIRKLRKNVRPQFIKERQLDGKLLPYVEAWHVIAEANRIFGHDGWDRETLSTQCVWQKQVDGKYGAAYVARVRISVRAEGIVVVREGFGAGEAYSVTPGQAHERAIKTAETDATKRALTTFGSSFGLALYQTKPTASADSAKSDEPDELANAELPAMNLAQMPSPTPEPSPSKNGAANPERTAADMRPQQNDDALSAKSPLEWAATDAQTPATPALQLRSSAVAPRPTVFATHRSGRDGTALSATMAQIPIDKSELLLGEVKRIRNTEHLRFVASLPCLVCGRQPSDAHHLRFTQARALGKKVSDEFTVPLCRFHHDEAHRAGAELRWWQARGIEPLSVSRDLWASSTKAEVL